MSELWHGERTGTRHISIRRPTQDGRKAQVVVRAASAGMPSAERIKYNGEGRAKSRGGCRRIRLTASAFWLCLATHCGRVGKCRLPHAAISAGWHLRLPRLPREEGLLHATPQLLFAASTPQVPSASELRKRSSWASTPTKSDVNCSDIQRLRITGFENANPVSRKFGGVLNNVLPPRAVISVDRVVCAVV